MYRLVFLSGPYKGKRLMIQQAAVEVGRDPDCHIHLSDEGVSWKHAVIEESGEGVTIRDLGSTNKIIVNSAEVRSAQLKHGDEVELGQTRLKFQLVQPLVPDQTRRMTHVQGVTFGMVVLVILLEIVFLVGLSFWRRGRPVEAAAPPAEEVAAASAAAATPVAVPVPVPVAEAVPAPVAETPPAAEEEAAAAPVEVAAVAQPAAEAEAEPPPEVTSPPAPPAAPEAAVSEEMPGATEKALPVEEDSAATAALPPELKADEEQAASDPLHQIAQEMLEEARMEIRKHNLVQADLQLERVQIVADDYFPAYAERAKLFEQRAMLKEAGEQWAGVMQRSAGTPWYEYAASERKRLAQKEAAGAAAKPPKPPEPAQVLANLPRRVRIDSVQRQKFEATDEFDEMYLITIVVRSRAGTKYIKGEEVVLKVSFYDREKDRKTVTPTAVLVPEDTLAFSGEWKLGERRTASAAYIVPKGFRDQEKRQFSRARDFYGYVVRAFFDGELQDVSARPEDLLDLAVKDGAASNQ